LQRGVSILLLGLLVTISHTPM